MYFLMFVTSWRGFLLLFAVIITVKNFMDGTDSVQRLTVKDFTINEEDMEVNINLYLYASVSLIIIIIQESRDE